MRGWVQKGLKELASEAGMEVPAADPRSAQRAEVQAGLHEVMAAAQDWFASRLEAPEGEVEQVTKLLRTAMMAAGELAVPLQVDVRSAANWAEAH